MTLPGENDVRVNRVGSSTESLIDAVKEEPISGLGG